MRGKEAIRRFLKQEKTARIFALAVIASALIWALSAIVGDESFQAFGAWGFVWNWMMLWVVYFWPVFYRRDIRLNRRRDTVGKVACLWFHSVPGPGVLFLVALVFTSGESAASDLSKSVWQVVSALTIIVATACLFGLVLNACYKTVLRVRRWLQNDTNQQPTT